MKRIVLPLFLAIALTTVAVPVEASEPNPEQTGRSVNCSHADGYPSLIGRTVSEDGESAFNHAIRQTPQAVTVDPGTAFELSAEDGSDVIIDFFDEDDQLVRYPGDGVVPEGAVWASVCVALAYPPLSITPNPVTTFHYQDGFPTES